MPTYEYSCRSCDRTIEVFQSMKDEPLSNCPQCGQPGVKRLIGRGAGIIFKGSGFYQTDYKSPSSSDTNKETSGGSDSSSKSPDSSPAKSEGKKDSAPASSAKVD